VLPNRVLSPITTIGYDASEMLSFDGVHLLGC